MFSFVKLLLILQVVSVWTAGYEVQWVPMIVHPAADQSETSYLQEMLRSSKQYDNENSAGKPPMDVLDFSPGFMKLLPSRIGNSGIFLRRLKFQSDTTTEPPTKNRMPQVNDISKNVYHTGNIDSIETTTEKIRDNSARNKVFFPTKVERLSLGDMLSSVPFFPSFDVPEGVDQSFSWLAELIVRVFSRLFSQKRGETDSGGPYTNVRAAEEMERLLLDHSKYSNRRPVPMELLLRNRKTMQTTDPYQSPVPYD